jgi:putative FmdB family regulatory protein
MPIYEYECGECGHRLEALQKLSEPPLTECPECRQAALTKLISPAAFHLKGSGWYVTDFRDKDKAKEKDKDKAKEGQGNGKAEGEKTAKGDGKEAKADTKGKGDDGGTSEKSASGKGAARSKKPA